MCDAVAKEGGEILKFIGDAMLAIFPIGTDASETCAAALSAAEQAQGALAQENARRERERRRASTTASRCMSATSCMAISAATPGSTSR
jgi:class 3 adenylate cyclase